MAFLTVGPNFEYDTIAEAMVDANNGDTIVLEAGYSNETATILYEGLKLDAGASSTGIVINLALSVTTFTLLGDGQVDVFDSSGANTIVGNTGDNVITVTDGADTVNGGLGEDRLVVDYRLAAGAVTGNSTSNFTEDGGSHMVTITDGTFEHFTILTGSGADTITTGNGDDIINTGEGAGTVTAGQGANRITGGSNADTITALDGGNIVEAGDGANAVTTGDGADIINGGIGADTIMAGGGADLITVRGGADDVDSGAGVDRLFVNYSAMTTNVTGGVTGGDLLAGHMGFISDGAGSTVDFVATEHLNFTGGSGNDMITAGDGDDFLFGGDGNDYFQGDAGNDIIDGGGGIDTMLGGAGNDTYVVDSLSDFVDEGVAGSDGDDLVRSSVSIALQDSTRFVGDIERVTFVNGFTGLNASGNALANTLTGNSTRNVLDGRSGADIMRGLGGDDIYYVDNVGDVVDETRSGSNGSDLVYASVSVDLQNTARFQGSIEKVTLLTGLGLNASGNALSNVLTGNNTRNILDGREGADVMRGRGGDDIYYIDNVDDVVDEAFAGSGGNDQVFSSVSVNLADAARFMGAIERVTLIDGIVGLNATGTADANVLIGNNVGNTLNGGAGADIMRGMGGFDTYIVDNVGDVVDESIAGSGGTDTVQGTISIDLTDTAHFKGSIERIVLQQGFAGLNATGNALDNQITGNAYGNFLNGKGGNDVLTGGMGVDRFVFDTALNAGTNVDTITDFYVPDDSIQLDDAIFTLLGAPGAMAAHLFKNTADGAVDADDRIIYNATTGSLSYDTNGFDPGGATQFAALSAGLAMTFKDFTII